MYSWGNYINHTLQLLFESIIYIYIYIYMLLLWGLSTQAKELTVATHVMQSSSYELSTAVSVYVKCKRMLKFNRYTLNSLAYVEILGDWGYVFKLAYSWSCFDPCLKHLACLATLMSCDTTKKSVWGWQWIHTYKYIYNDSDKNIYIYRERERTKGCIFFFP